jgi:hypothetical protein
VDTRLSPTDSTFEFQLAQIAEVLMEPLAIIEPFNKRKDLPARFVPDMWKKKGQTE